MAWVTVAEGTTIDSLQPVVGDFKLRKGCPIRYTLNLKMPVAKAFDMGGAELIFRGAMPAGVILKDVHSEGWSTVVIEAESDPAWLLGIIVFIKSNWIVLSLLTIGLFVSLGFLVIASKMRVPEEFVEEVAELAKWVVIGGAVLGGYLLLRPVVERKAKGAEHG